MSHFCVGVHVPAGNENIIENIQSYLETALQPWHEYECTGIDDQYVQQVDNTQDLIDAYTHLRVAYIDKEREGTKQYVYPYSFAKDKLKRRQLTEQEVKDRELQQKNFEQFQKYQIANREVSIKNEGGITYAYYIPEEYPQVMVAQCHLESLSHFIESNYNIELIINDLSEAPEDEAYAYINPDIDTGPYPIDMSVEDIKKLLNGNVQLFIKTNPNSKWDWWQIGGRFRFTNKQNKNVSMCKIKDLQIKDKHTYAIAEKMWDIIMEDKFDGSPEERQSFLMQYGWGISKENLERKGSKEAYAEYASRFRTYAFVKDGQWYEPGEMGWFACSNATAETQEAYDKMFDEMIMNANPEDYFVCVDCHI